MAEYSTWTGVTGRNPIPPDQRVTTLAVGEEGEAPKPPRYTIPYPPEVGHLPDEIPKPPKYVTIIEKEEGTPKPINPPNPPDLRYSTMAVGEEGSIGLPPDPPVFVGNPLPIQNNYHLLLIYIQFLLKYLQERKKDISYAFGRV